MAVNNGVFGTMTTVDNLVVGLSEAIYPDAVEGEDDDPFGLGVLGFALFSWSTAQDRCGCRAGAYCQRALYKIPS